MAGNRRVISLGLDYSQFDGGITDVNSKMQLLDAQFRLTTEQTRSLGNESDQLALRQQYLTQKIALQTQTVAHAKEAYDRAVESGRASDRQLDNLQRAYINSQTALERLNNELNDNNTQMENAGDTSASFGDSIRGMASTLGIEVNPALEAVASKFDGVSKEAGNAALVIAAVVTALSKMTLSTAETAGEIDELAHKTGLSTDKIQELNYAAEFLEISAEEIGSSITKLTKNMDTARTGTGAAAEAFKQLGVRIKDSRGNLLDSETVFYNTIDALGKIRNETEKEAISMAIFGKSAMSLNNLILEGSEGMKEYAKQAHEAGYVMDEETIVSFNEMDDAMVKFNKKLEAVEMTLGQTLLPAFEFFADLLSDIPTPVLVGVFVFGVLAAIILSVAKAASTMAIANTMLAGTNAVVGATGQTATKGMLPLLGILLALAAVIALIIGVASGIGKAMKDVETSVGGVVETANAAAENLENSATKSGTTRSTYRNTTSYRGYASGTDDYPGGEAWIGENGPEFVRLPRGSKVYNNEESKKISGNTYITNYIEIPAKDVKEFNDITRIVQSQQQAHRRGVQHT